MDWFPQINWVEPESERAEARHLHTQLHMLRHLEDRFRSAEGLISHAEGAIVYLKMTGRPIQERAVVADWTLIAGHYAVLSVYHFRDAICSIRDRLNYAPTLKKRVDVKMVDAARERFEAEFPRWRELHDCAAHFVDKIYSPAKIEKHGSKTDAFYHGTMEGTRTIRYTHDGQPIRQSVSLDEAEKLKRVRLEVYEAFRKV